MTAESERIRRLHTYLPGWWEANVAFVRGGGYSVAAKMGEASLVIFVIGFHSLGKGIFSVIRLLIFTLCPLLWTGRQRPFIPIIHTH